MNDAHDSNVNLQPKSNGSAPRPTNPPRPPVDPGQISFEQTEAAEEGGSARIPLDELDDKGSGASLFSWAEILRQRTASSEEEADIGELPKVQIDAISDKDLLRKIQREEGYSLPSEETSPSQVVNLAGDASRPAPAGVGTPPVPDSGNSDVLSHLIDSKRKLGDPKPSGPSTLKLPADAVQAQANEAARKVHPPSGNAESAVEDDGDLSTVNLLASPPRISPLEMTPSQVRAFSKSDSDISLNGQPSLPDPEASAVDLGGPPVPRSKRRSSTSFDLDMGMPQPPRTVSRPGSKPVVAIRPERSRSTLSSWLGGTVLGAAVAVGTGYGLWSAGLLPGRSPAVVPNKGGETQPIVIAPTPPVAPPAPVAPAPDAARAFLEAGDPDAALKAFENVGATPEVLTGRGQARWLAYLRAQRLRGATVRSGDPEAEAARRDLADANTPEAALWLGLTDEAAGNWDAARAGYRRAMQTYPDRAKLFQAALDRIEALKGEGPKTTSMGPRPQDPALGWALHVILLVGPGGEPDEAGIDFWQAVKLARKHDYAAAREALLRAKAAHDLRRVLHPRTGQNPLSDPQEEIFLVSCDELLAYWDVRAKLHNGGFPLDRYATAAGAVEAALSSRKQLEGTVRLLAAKLKTEDLSGVGPALDAVLTARDRADADRRALEAQRRTAEAERATADAAKRKAEGALEQFGSVLAAAGFDGDASASLTKLIAARRAAEDMLKDTAAKLNAAGAREAEANRELARLGASRKEADDTIRAVADKLREAKLVSEKPAPPELLKALDSVLRGDFNASRAELLRFRQILAKAHTPEKMLDLWPRLLESPAGRDLAPAALADAAAVAADPAAAPLSKAKAKAVTGFARLANDEFAAARQAFEQSDGDPNLSGDPAWGARLLRAKAELHDPDVVTRRAADLLDRGATDEALAAIERGLKMFPRETAAVAHGRLLVLRGDAALSRNQTEAAIKDAAAAHDCGATLEAYYLAGAVYQRRNVPAKAQTYFREALAAAKDPAQAKRVRAALAAVMPAPDAGPAELAEATKLAEQMIAAGQPEGRLLKARVLQRSRRHAEALEESLVALRDLAPAGFADRWEESLKELPKATRPAATTPPAAVETPDPAEAERRFVAGLSLYRAGKFAEAEEAFRAAVRLNDQDARFFYFRGLARTEVGQADEADEDFRTGSMLERLGKPGRGVINGYLERIQGSARQALSRFRS